MQPTFALNDNKDSLIVTGCEGIMGSLIIPSEQEFEGKMYPVTAIAPMASAKRTCFA